MNKTYSIEDLLNSMKSPSRDSDGLSIKDIWDMIISGESLEKMGFSSEQDKKNWIENNPYDNI